MARNSYLIVNEELTSRLLQGCDLQSNPFAVALQRREAREAVIRAIAGGVLSRPRECSACHCFCKPQGHHEDYDKPLEVQWLCPKCHKRADMARRLRDDPVRPSGDNFAAFLLVNGEVSLPFTNDPPDDGCNEDVKAIRSLYFAGFQAIKGSYERSVTAPMAAAVLSCGHHDLIHPNRLSDLPTAVWCYLCASARWDRADRRRAARRIA